MKVGLYSVFLLGISMALSGCLIPFPCIEKVPIPAATGRVVTAKTEEPIADVNIRIRGHRETAVLSDKLGYFTTKPSKGLQFSLFGSLYTPQRYELVLERLDYLPTRVQLVRGVLMGQNTETIPPVLVGNITVKPIE